jgi:DNA-binding winged helix-turn-helix (wHTH) protein
MDVDYGRHRPGVYAFGEFMLDAVERVLTRGVYRLHLAPKTFDVLTALVEQSNRLVTKQALLDRVWPGVFVEEGILSVHVAQLRKVLGDSRRAPRYFETVSGSGYRFIGAVPRDGTGVVAERRHPPPSAGSGIDAPL